MLSNIGVFGKRLYFNNYKRKVVAQLVERLLSNPVMGKIYIERLLYWKDENK